MSFVSDATEKLSSHAPSSVLPSLSSELELYKKRFRLAVLAFASVATLAAGYGVGYWLKPLKDQYALPLLTTAQEQEVVQMPSQPANTELKTKTPSESEPLQSQTQVATVNTDAALKSTAQHYQWLSVQVGMDQFGQPIYQQQLVPVTNDGTVALSASSRTVLPVTPVPRQPLSTQMPPSEDIASLTAQGYRVAGKPLETSTPEVELNFDGVSPELKAAFKDAVQATENNPSADVITTTNSSARVPPIDALPERFKASIPPFKYLTHIYATEPSMRFIKINGRELYEGDNIGALRVIEITPEMTVFDFDGVEFSVEAMEDWPKG